MLLDWLGEAHWDRVGCFKYENVAGARSNNLRDHFPEEIKQDRWDRFMAISQAIITANWLQRSVKILRSLWMILTRMAQPAALRRMPLKLTAITFLMKA